jgi:hypothetical protein
VETEELTRTAEELIKTAEELDTDEELATTGAVMVPTEVAIDMLPISLVATDLTV